MPRLGLGHGELSNRGDAPEVRSPNLSRTSAAVRCPGETQFDWQQPGIGSCQTARYIDVFAAAVLRRVLMK
jgi:hypothetical protein